MNFSFIVTAVLLLILILRVKVELSSLPCQAETAGSVAAGGTQARPGQVRGRAQCQGHLLPPHCWTQAGNTTGLLQGGGRKVK